MDDKVISILQEFEEKSGVRPSTDVFAEVPESRQLFPGDTTAPLPPSFMVDFEIKKVLGEG